MSTISSCLFFHFFSTLNLWFVGASSDSQQSLLSADAFQQLRACAQACFAYSIEASLMTLSAV
jgi:hypothetical protein